MIDLPPDRRTEFYVGVPEQWYELELNIFCLVLSPRGLDCLTDLFLHRGTKQLNYLRNISLTEQLIQSVIIGFRFTVMGASGLNAAITGFEMRATHLIYCADRFYERSKIFNSSMISIGMNYILVRYLLPKTVPGKPDLSKKTSRTHEIDLFIISLKRFKLTMNFCPFNGLPASFYEYLQHLRLVRRRAVCPLGILITTLNLIRYFYLGFPVRTRVLSHEDYNCKSIHVGWSFQRTKEVWRKFFPLNTMHYMNPSYGAKRHDRLLTIISQPVQF